ncbi:MAG: hypothetical protein AAF766_15330 [Cyanobacteria bacterium P01_D01_bin.14]
MKRFILSSLSLVVAAGTVAPAANAQEINKVFDLQASRLEHLDNQTKSDDSLLDTTLQQRRISELNERTKNAQSSDDSLVGTTLQQRRISELNQRTKDDSLVGTTLQQRLLEERNARTK